MPLARSLMFQGTGSDVGKSLIVAGLCRAFVRRGLRVLPFKPQNMSNNAAVTADGGEIGRAQALQARACGVPSSVHMNPVLLKPQSDVGAQVVVQGKVVGNATAREYQQWKPRLLDSVTRSFDILRAQADLVLVEGAGSASEINLRNSDIANMGFARRTDTPVILIGDIDRGGVIAQIAGTKLVIHAADAALIKGFIVNRFRGDPALFSEGLHAIEGHTGWPSLGLVPYFAEAGLLPAEDSVALERRRDPGRGHIVIAVPLLPHIANFDDLDPLEAEPDVRLVLVRAGETLPVDADLVVLPGSKATIADLIAFKANGWDIDLRAHHRRGGRILGICGGYQMLGSRVSDPDGIEGNVTEIAGLGLLNVETSLVGAKTLQETSGVSCCDQAPFKGYEMHIGKTAGPDGERPLLRFADGRDDGASSPDGHVMGTYVHGLFADDRQRAAWLKRLGGSSDGISYEATIDRVLDGLAGHLETCLDLDRLLSLAR